MASNSDTIPKNPVLDICQDYLALRRKGIEYIEKSGSRWWTDYNSHDPGITILEALCYAITDLGYRTGWNISDILATPEPCPDDSKNQAFFTAREILTVSPLTLNDYRRILIDMDNVSNAWLLPRQSSCETGFHADCRNGRLCYTHTDNDQKFLPVSPRGTYNVLLELENNTELGDLNDRKIRHVFILSKDTERHAVTLELRFPGWNPAKWGNAGDYVDENGNIIRKIKKVEAKLSLQKSGEPDTLSSSEKEERWRQWQRVFYADIKISFENTGVDTVELDDLPFRIFGTSKAKAIFTSIMTEKWDFREVAEMFIKKMAMVERTLQQITTGLHNHRNLCEDFCCSELVCIQDVAVCADIEVTANADIERVLANVLFRIEHYFNPGIRFYTLQELMSGNMAVEEIFEGPQLEHGFVRTPDLESTRLKSQLRTSDIINELVEIDGVVAVKNLRLTRYDRDGIAETGAADGGKGSNRNKISAEWTLEISDNCQPRLYVDNSNFIFYKNGLPFAPRSSEVQDTLNQLRGEKESLKFRNLSDTELDLPVPTGTCRKPDDCSPVQYLLPLAYGTGPEGLREPATDQRRAQARQLKAYLMVFEQLLANAFSQLANVRNLFTLDESMLQSYFVKDLRNETLIRGVTDLLKPSLTETGLKALVESESEMLERRNRFLDHLMARFGEHFTEYALLLTNHEGAQVTPGDLIVDKSAFLKACPLISRERARSFNYRQMPQTAGNQTVLRKRIALLLGFDPATEDQMIIVEHLLLRPKFPGDALMEVCFENSCPKCGEEDPYSFKYTVIMPGWIPPYDTNIELRRFADRTIQMEMPSHLLGRICWVIDSKQTGERDSRLKNALAILLHEEGRNAGNARPAEANAQKGAEKIFLASRNIFLEWINSEETKPLDKPEISVRIDTLLHKNIEPLETIYGGVKNYDLIGKKIFSMLVEHFTITVDEMLFDHFKGAWKEWLEENARLNWCTEKVVEKIGSLLSKKQDDAMKVVMVFAGLFSEEMRKNVLNGVTITDRKTAVGNIFDAAFPENRQSGKVAKVSLSIQQKKILRETFIEIYVSYIDVTMALWRVLILLSRLHSVYPPVTLHDCDDGNDENPVRLGSTNL